MSEKCPKKKDIYLDQQLLATKICSDIVRPEDPYQNGLTNAVHLGLFSDHNKF